MVKLTVFLRKQYSHGKKNPSKNTGGKKQAKYRRFWRKQAFLKARLLILKPAPTPPRGGHCQQCPAFFRRADKVLLEDSSLPSCVEGAGVGGRRRERREGGGAVVTQWFRPWPRGCVQAVVGSEG